MSRDRMTFEGLLGKTILEIQGLVGGSEEVTIVTDDGRTFKMFHYQDCCESVRINDVNGNVEDLIGSPITMAEETSDRKNSDWDSQTWTFYKLATMKGFVDIRWLGESNGYYSEAVDFVEIKGEKSA